jgi:prolyl-tRNA synthetase
VRWSQSFIPTLKETPADAEIPSHQLLLRAGLVRKLHSGVFTFLPLGLRALRKVERIVREEMDRAGATEILMPALHPAELWQRTGRYETMKDVVFKIKDRKDSAWLLGPTHEEVVTDLAAREISSYKQLPVNFYQVQTKFRDEIRPRFGLMRAREFVMKDAYSFDATWEGLDRSYQAMYDAYVRIFHRCGLRVKVVEADTGAMGGNQSHEFMVLTEAGEDGVVECGSCAYAANLEKAVHRPLPPPAGGGGPLAHIPTPGQRTIEEVGRFLDLPHRRLLKTLVYVADGKPVVFVLAGDRELNEVKARAATGAAEIRPADDRVIAEVAQGAPAGYLGPIGVTARVIVDAGLRGLVDGVTGANRLDTHIGPVDLARDVPQAEYLDLASVKPGDICAQCGGTLDLKRGVEVGHVFKLGTKYSTALGANFLDADGKSQVAIMGCYGIGVSRTLQAVLEQSHDAQGLRWPVSVAPFEVNLVQLSPGDPAAVKVAEELYAALRGHGVDVLYDDRDERPGFKFKDADLIGLPLRVNVGGKSLARGVVELKARADGALREVPLAEAATAVVAQIEAWRAALQPE